MQTTFCSRNSRRLCFVTCFRVLAKGNACTNFMQEVCALQIILEGMGRAIHTNFNAKFKCDALKVMGVIDNECLLV